MPSSCMERDVRDQSTFSEGDVFDCYVEGPIVPTGSQTGESERHTLTPQTDMPVSRSAGVNTGFASPGMAKKGVFLSKSAWISFLGDLGFPLKPEQVVPFFVRLDSIVCHRLSGDGSARRKHGAHHRHGWYGRPHPWPEGAWLGVAGRFRA